MELVVSYCRYCKGISNSDYHDECKSLVDGYEPIEVTFDWSKMYSFLDEWKVLSSGFIYFTDEPRLVCESHNSYICSYMFIWEFPDGVRLLVSHDSDSRGFYGLVKYRDELVRVYDQDEMDTAVKLCWVDRWRITNATNN